MVRAHAVYKRIARADLIRFSGLADSAASKVTVENRPMNMAGFRLRCVRAPMAVDERGVTGEVLAQPGTHSSYQHIAVGADATYNKINTKLGKTVCVAGGR